MKYNNQKLLKKKSTKAKKRAKKRRALKRKLKNKKIFLDPNNICDYTSTIMSGGYFWDNYRIACEWQKHYSSIVQYSPLVLDETINQSSPISEEPQLKTEEYTDLDSTYTSSEYSRSDQIKTESDDEYEVTEEMMKFLEISMRHKAELKLKKQHELEKIGCSKKEQKKKKISERDNIEECQAPKERAVDAKRIEEMNDLYGSSTAMIMGMETALQLTFNRNCDVNKPIYWPYLPLNLKFSS